MASPTSIKHSMRAGVKNCPCSVVIKIAEKSKKSILSLRSLRKLSQARLATGTAVMAMVPPTNAAGTGNPKGPPKIARVVAKTGNFIPPQALFSSGSSTSFLANVSIGIIASPAS